MTETETSPVSGFQERSNLERSQLNRIVKIKLKTGEIMIGRVKSMGKKSGRNAHLINVADDQSI